MDDEGNHADYQHDELRAHENHEQTLYRHRYLDGVPATLYHYMSQKRIRGHWNASQAEFVYKRDDTFCVYHGEVLRQHILVLGWKECIGYITLDIKEE